MCGVVQPPSLLCAQFNQNQTVSFLLHSTHIFNSSASFRNCVYIPSRTFQKYVLVRLFYLFVFAPNAYAKYTCFLGDRHWLWNVCTMCGKMKKKNALTTPFGTHTHSIHTAHEKFFSEKLSIVHHHVMYALCLLNLLKFFLLVAHMSRVFTSIDIPCS